VMKSESEKYDKILNLLKKSQPELDSAEKIEREVINRISGIKKPAMIFSEVIDFMFGWIYIGWVRKTLIAASVVLVIIFVYQQGIILKQIDLLSRQTIINNKNSGTSSDEIEKLLTIYRISGKRFPSKSVTISEREMKELLESIKELQLKYKDLENLIEEDPELRKIIEEKLLENSHTKTNL
jgi:hypothetical protein